MPLSAPRRRLWPWFAGGLAALVLAGVLARRPLAAAVITTSLRMAGAGDVRLAVTEASPWQVEMQDVSLRFRTQRFAAEQITFERASWWQPTLGAVRVAGARVPVTLDGSDTNPWAWSTYTGSGGGGVSPAAALAVPVEEVTVDGVLAVQVAGQPEQELRVHFAARLDDGRRWSGNATAEAPGFRAEVTAGFSAAKGTLDFQVTRAELDLQRWEGFVQQLVVLPGGRWELAGRLSGTAEGGYADGQLVANGTVRLREGRFVYPARGVTAEGVEADFTFTDFDRFTSAPGTVRIAELKAGEIRATALDLELAFLGPEHVAVSRASLEALGGRLAAEPFNFFPRQDELEATLLADGIDMAQVLALVKDPPAKAQGRVDGRVPIRIDASGLRFGSGWLELKRGVYAEVQLNAAGLLTRGVSPSDLRYATLQRVESGLLRLKLAELRLDLRPRHAPPGRTATIKLVGEPVDPTVKAPVNLDLNINGPLEQLLNLGLDSRVRFGGF